MLEISGNFFNEAHKYELIVCTINKTVKDNGALVMGKGIALDFKNMFPEIDFKYGNLIKNGKKHIFTIEKYCDRSIITYGLITKTDWKFSSPPQLVIDSCSRLKDFVDFLEIESVLMTRPGCGNGGLEWDYVKPRLNFDDRFTVIERVKNEER